MLCKVHELGRGGTGHSQTRPEIKAMHSKPHDIPLASGVSAQREGPALGKHSEKQLHNEGQRPNPARSSTWQLCKELSSRLQLPSTLQDPGLVSALHADARG